MAKGMMAKNMKKKAPAAPAAPVAPQAPAGASETADKGEKVRFTIYISPEMKKNLRLAQVDQDRPMNSIVVDALDQYLKGVGLEKK